MNNKPLKSMTSNTFSPSMKFVEIELRFLEAERKDNSENYPVFYQPETVQHLSLIFEDYIIDEQMKNRICELAKKMMDIRKVSVWVQSHLNLETATCTYKKHHFDNHFAVLIAILESLPKKVDLSLAGATLDFLQLPKTLNIGILNLPNNNDPSMIVTRIVDLSVKTVSDEDYFGIPLMRHIHIKCEAKIDRLYLKFNDYFYKNCKYSIKIFLDTSAGYWNMIPHQDYGSLFNDGNKTETSTSAGKFVQQFDDKFKDSKALLEGASQAWKEYYKTAKKSNDDEDEKFEDDAKETSQGDDNKTDTSTSTGKFVQQFDDKFKDSKALLEGASQGWKEYYKTAKKSNDNENFEDDAKDSKTLLEGASQAWKEYYKTAKKSNDNENFEDDAKETSQGDNGILYATRNVTQEDYETFQNCFYVLPKLPNGEDNKDFIRI